MTIRELDPREVAAMRVVCGIVDDNRFLAAVGIRRGLFRRTEAVTRLASLGVALEVIEATLGLTRKELVGAIRSTRRDLMRALYSGGMRTREIRNRLEVCHTKISKATVDIPREPAHRKKHSRKRAPEPVSAAETTSVVEDEKR